MSGIRSMLLALVGVVGTASTIMLGGCSTFRDPQVTIVSASVVETSDEAMTLHITADLANPNDESLQLLNFNYHVTVDGQRVFQGIRSAEATLGGNQQRQVTIPAVVRFVDVGWSPTAVPADVEYAVSGTLQYITPGSIAQILFDSGVRKPRAGFRGTVATTASES